MTRRNKMRAVQLDPNFYVLEDETVQTQDTVVSKTILTNSIPSRMYLSMRSLILNWRGGATDCRYYVILRRVPSGYTAPSFVVSTGLTAIADQPDVLAVGTGLYELANTTRLYTRISWIKKNTVLFEGDSLVLQMVINANSSGLAAFGEAEFGTKIL